MRKLILLIMVLSFGLMGQSVGGAGSANQTNVPGNLYIYGKTIFENIDEFTEEATPVAGDSVLIWDSSADTYDRAALGDLPGTAFEIDQLTGENAPALTDTLAMWDITADAHRRIEVQDVLELITGGDGLSADATVINLDIDNLTEDASALTDSLVFWDVTGDDHNREVVADLLALITGGEGLSYDATTMNMDIDNLTEDTPVATDSLVFWDVDGDDHNRMGIDDIDGLITAYTGGDGLSVDAYVINLDFDNLTEDTPVATDSMAFWDITADAHKLMVVADLGVDGVVFTAGEGLSNTTTTLDLDIDNLTEDAAVATDSVLFWDVTGDDHNREVITDLLALMTAAQAETILTNDDLDLGTGDIAVTEITIGTLLTLEPNGDSANPATYANDASVASTSSLMRIAGNGGAVVLDTDTAIDDGAADGQVLIIQGTHDTNTVQIVDAVNTSLAGGVSFIFGDKDMMILVWDSDDSNWQEVSRSDN